MPGRNLRNSASMLPAGAIGSNASIPFSLPSACFAAVSTWSARRSNCLSSQGSRTSQRWIFGKVVWLVVRVSKPPSTLILDSLSLSTKP